MSTREHIHLPRHLGDRVSDKVSASVGSWPFIIIQSVILACWIVLNSLALFVWKWDPPPFILLNLCLSFQAAFTAPIIMISQNRQASKDHARDDLEAQEVERLVQQQEEIKQLQEEVKQMTLQQNEMLAEHKKILDQQTEMLVLLKEKKAVK